MQRFGDRLTTLLALSLLERLTPRTVRIGRELWSIRVRRTRIDCARDGREISFALVNATYLDDVSLSICPDGYEGDVERLLENIAVGVVREDLIHIDGNDWFVGLERLEGTELVIRCETLGDRTWFGVRMQGYTEIAVR